MPRALGGRFHRGPRHSGSRRPRAGFKYLSGTLGRAVLTGGQRRYSLGRRVAVEGFLVRGVFMRPPLFLPGRRRKIAACFARASSCSDSLRADSQYGHCVRRQISWRWEGEREPVCGPTAHVSGCSDSLRADSQYGHCVRRRISWRWEGEREPVCGADCACFRLQRFAQGRFAIWTLRAETDFLAMGRREGTRLRGRLRMFPAAAIRSGQICNVDIACGDGFLGDGKARGNPSAGPTAHVSGCSDSLRADLQCGHCVRRRFLLIEKCRRVPAHEANAGSQAGRRAMFCGFSARLSSVNARANACENRVLAAALRTATAAARAGFSERFRDRRCGALPGARLPRYRRSRLCIEGLRHCRARRCGVDIANEAMLHMLSAGLAEGVAV